MTNWIADANRFVLPKPPAWFLTALWSFDPLLVILPSRIKPVYVLARRRNLTLRVPLMRKAQDQLLRDTIGSDGDMLAGQSLLPVDTIVPRAQTSAFGTWSMDIIGSLRERDIVAAGGADQYADRLDAADEKLRTDQRVVLTSDMEHRAGDAFRSLQARTGQRTRLTIPSTPKTSSSSTAGSGIIITG